MTRSTPLRWSLTDALRFFSTKDGKVPPLGSDKDLMLQAAGAITMLEQSADALRLLVSALQDPDRQGPEVARALALAEESLAALDPVSFK